MSSRKSSIAKKAKNGAELTAQQLELRYPPTSSLYCLRNSLWVWSKETMTSNYLTVSHARHVTFPECFLLGYGAFDTLSSLLLLLHIPPNTLIPIDERVLN